MSVSQLGEIRVPPSAAVWIDRLMLVFLGLFVVWVVLKLIGFAMRRSYNLTPAATAGSRDIKPDFLQVDHAAQKQMIERGREFDRGAAPSVVKAASLTNWGVVVSGLVSFVSAAFLAFGRIEELDKTWQDVSARDRFAAIIGSHPIGFTLALAMIVAALVRLTMTFRKAK